MITLSKHKIAYTATPKVACSSVKLALAQIDGKADLIKASDSAPDDVVHGIYQTRRFRPERWNDLQGFWRFTVVRDPLSRLLSAYQNRVLKRGVLLRSRRIRAGWEGLTTDPDPDFFFQNLQKYRDASSDVKHHILPANLFVGNDRNNYDAIYPIERLGELENDLSNLTSENVQFQRWNSSASKLSLEDLQPQTRDALRLRLEPLYKNQIWDYDSPFA